MTLYKSLNITNHEYSLIKKLLKREPNELETYLFSAMWSEHCSYKHSKKYLKNLYKKGALYTEENAGGIAIGNSVVVFKVESHNHPCAVEPFQGAATGIGGIIRDVLAVNARPIALLDSLKFGKYNEDKTKHLLDGVVKGISSYGNSIGVPTIGGETIFDTCYTDSPLVNVMAVGIANKKNIKLAAASPNNYVVLLGSSTGKDGVHGASFASKELTKDSHIDRPSVQIGDAFMKKILIEATLEILKSKNIIACQDCGAAGLLSSTSEMVYKGNCGIKLNLDKVHLRENLTPWQIMLSESQERMIFIANDNGVKEIFNIAKKYDIPVSNIGETINEKEYKLLWDNQTIANVSPDILCEGIEYSINEKEPNYIQEYKNKKQEKTFQLNQVIQSMENNANTTSKKYIFSQYDYMVGNRTCIKPEKGNCAGLWLYEEDKYIAFTIDSKPLQVFLNPYQGMINTFLESYRNLIAQGFEPKGLTNCLNYGNPEKDDIGYQFTQSTKALSNVCEFFDIPVVSGNVSFYNESEKHRVFPTPTVGMIGVCNKKENIIEAKFAVNEYVYILGKDITENSNIGGSLYQREVYDYLGGQVDNADFEFEIKLKETIFSLRDKNILKACTDISQGGLYIALKEALNELELDNKLKNNEKYLFGEINGRYLISTSTKLENMSIEVTYLGKCIKRN